MKTIPVWNCHPGLGLIMVDSQEFNAHIYLQFSEILPTTQVEVLVSASPSVQVINQSCKCNNII